MALYTMYWPDWMCDRAREQGLEGHLLRLLWGGHNQDTRFSRFKVGPGDRVVPVTAIDGVLHALASVEVVEKTSAERWLPAHPEDAATRLHGCGSELLVARPDAGWPLAFNRPFTSQELEQWRYDGTSGPRPLKFLEHGKLKKSMSVQGVYRVTPSTEALVDAAFARATGPAPKTTVTSLEAALRQRPDDEAAARVLADAWLEQGDARGEVLALELALANETEPGEVAALDTRHAALLRATVGSKKVPGGFPFRAFQGGRAFTELGADGLTLRADLPEVMTSAFFELAARLLEVEGAHRVEVLRDAGPVLAKRLEALAARPVLGSGASWTRRRPFSPGEVTLLVDAGAPLRLWVAGPLRAREGGGRLPFQAPSQWLGSCLTSELELSLADRSMRWWLRVPDGTPLSRHRREELEQLITRLGGRASRRRLRRTAGGDRPVT